MVAKMCTTAERYIFIEHMKAIEIYKSIKSQNELAKKDQTKSPSIKLESSLPSELLLLEISQRDITSTGKHERQLETDITSILGSAEFANGASEPDLSHAQDSTSGSDAESEDCGKSRWELALVHVIFWVIAGETALEDDMFREGDTLIDGEPVSDEQHEVFKDGFECSVTWDSDCAVEDSSEEGPNITRSVDGLLVIFTLRGERWHLHFLGGTSHELERKSDGVDVGAVVGNDGESKNDKAELTEFAQRRNDDSGDQSSNVRSVISIHVDVLSTIVGHCGSDGCTEHLSEEEREDKTTPCPEEDCLAGSVYGLINSVISCVRSPAGSETEDRGSERESSSSFRDSDSHWDVVEFSGLGECSKNDEEDDEAWNPGESLIGVHNLVAEAGDDECRDCDNQNSSPSRHVVVYSMEELSANNNVDG